MDPRANLEVTQLLETLPNPIQDITSHLRKLILETSPDIIEEVKWSKPSYALNGLVCYLAPAKHHVNLGFYLGAKLPDPEGILQGTGKQMRHIQVKKVEDIKPELFKSMIMEAIELNS